MFVHAGHEVVHSRFPDHGEYHSSYMGDLLTNAAGLFAAWPRNCAAGNRRPVGNPVEVVIGTSPAYSGRMTQLII